MNLVKVQIPADYVVAAWGERVGELCVPAGQEVQGRAELAAMQRRGEIECAFDARHELRDGKRVYVVNYVRLREPRSRAPLYAMGGTAFLAGVGAIGWLLYESRWVLLSLLAAGVVVALIAWLASRSATGGTCSGVHVKH